jgi:hypothetical protein
VGEGEDVGLGKGKKEALWGRYCTAAPRSEKTLTAAKVIALHILSPYSLNLKP